MKQYKGIEAEEQCWLFYTKLRFVCTMFFCFSAFNLIISTFIIISATVFVCFRIQIKCDYTDYR